MQKGLLVSTLLAFCLNLTLIFFYAPLERTMGIVQKIFYFHLSVAWIGFFAFFIVFIQSILYLKTRNPIHQQIALASGELGTLFSTLVLLTGPLWAYPVWNTWWTWDPRLTSTLIMWFMYVGYLMLHHAELQEAIRLRLTAVYGIIAFTNAPLVFFSIRWWRTLHPVGIVASGSGLEPRMRITLFFSLFSFLLLYSMLLFFRLHQLRCQARISALTQRIYSKE